MYFRVVLGPQLLLIVVMTIKTAQQLEVSNLDKVKSRDMVLDLRLEHLLSQTLISHLLVFTRHALP